METQLLYFAALAEALHQTGETLNLEPGITGQGLLDLLAGRYPDQRLIIQACSLAQNEEFLGLAETLTPGATTALLPPVSGG